MFKVNNWRRSGVFIVNFKHISHLVLVFLLLTLNFEQVIVVEQVIAGYHDYISPKEV